MTDILVLIAITSIWVIGIKIATDKKMVLRKVGFWANKKVEDGYEIFEALLTCAWCMASIHSVVGFTYGIFFLGMEWRILFTYPIVVMGTSLTCGVIWTVVQIILKKLELLINQTKLSGWDISDRSKSHKENFNKPKKHYNGEDKRRHFQHEG